MDLMLLLSTSMGCRLDNTRFVSGLENCLEREGNWLAWLIMEWCDWLVGSGGRVGRLGREESFDLRLARGAWETPSKSWGSETILTGGELGCWRWGVDREGGKDGGGRGR